MLRRFTDIIPHTRSSNWNFLPRLDNNMVTNNHSTVWSRQEVIPLIDPWYQKYSATWSQEGLSKESSLSGALIPNLAKVGRWEDDEGTLVDTDLIIIIGPSSWHRSGTWVCCPRELQRCSASTTDTSL